MTRERSVRVGGREENMGSGCVVRTGGGGGGTQESLCVRSDGLGRAGGGGAALRVSIGWRPPGQNVYTRQCQPAL